MRPIVKTRSIKWGIAAVCALAPVYSALAQDAPASPEDQAQQAVDLRQSLFRLIGYSWGPVAGMLKNKIPFDPAAVQKSSARLEQLTPMIGEMFQTDTRKFTLKTKAREGIWTNKSDFTAKNDDLVKAVQNLSTAAKTGDKKQFQMAAGAVGKACGACHDNFRDK